MTDKSALRSALSHWVEQERAWGSDLYASERRSIGASEQRQASEHGSLGASEQRQASERRSIGASEQGQASEPRSIGASEQRPFDVSPTLRRPEAPTRVTTAPTPSPDKAAALSELYERYKNCTRCRLGLTRIKIVFGVGSPNAEVLFIGEGPGYEEDRRGEPFVGKAGQLLDKIMASIGLSRQTNAYIANIVKCHPMTDPGTPEARGNDRPPAPDEVATCSPILLQQIAILQPRIIVTLGSPSTRMVLQTKDAITKLRGNFFPFPVDAYYPQSSVESEGATLPGEAAPPLIEPATREALRAIRVLPTFHPAALLRNPNLKPDTWTDMKRLRDTLAQPR